MAARHGRWHRSDMASLWIDPRRLDLPATTPWRPDARYDAVVVGAGLTGLATAALLARRGLGVGVLEARSVGAVTTGNTTGKVSLLQGTTLSQISRLAGADAASTYVRANRAGQDWLLEELGSSDQALQRRDAWTYATTAEGRHRATQEWTACRDAGLPVEAADVGSTELPFPVVAALRLPDQAQVDAGRLLRHLLRAVLDAGGEVVEGVRVTGVAPSLPGEVSTDHGPVHAGHVVLATGTPVLDRHGHFALLEPSRSYGAAYQVPGPIPVGMYLSADSVTRSLRTAPTQDGELLVVGGNGHSVGRPDQRGLSPAQLVLDLHEWTEEHFPGATRTHRWSAQDYSSPDLIPFVGPLAGTDGRLLLATGYHKWGMTNGAAAALALAGHVVGKEVPEWADLLSGRGVGLGRAKEVARFNAAVAARMAAGWAGAVTSGKADQAPPEGQGEVRRAGRSPAAVSTVDGVTRTVSAVCPHLGGVLAWNDAECSWDCPLHGSRFGADGTLLEGPATSDLPRS